MHALPEALRHRATGTESPTKGLARSMCILGCLSCVNVQAKYGSAAAGIFAAAKRVFAALPLAARIAGEALYLYFSLYDCNHASQMDQWQSGGQVGTT